LYWFFIIILNIFLERDLNVKWFIVIKCQKRRKENKKDHSEIFLEIF